VPRMIVADGGVVRLVPFNAATPHVVENHVRADISYITVD
jgi:hypothetical protein